MYLTQCIHRNVQQQPHALAFVQDVQHRTWTEFRDRVARFAGALRRSGLAVGDRVGLIAKNTLAFPEYVFGTVWAGGVINPVNHRLSAEEMAFSLQDCVTSILLAQVEFLPVVERLLSLVPALRTVVLIGGDDPRFPQYEEWLAGDPTDDAIRRGEDLAAILYTGGTTGRSKGVMLSHGNLLSSAMGILASEVGRSGPRYLHSAPLFHVGGLSGLVQSMISGSRGILLPDFVPETVMEVIEREAITDFFMVPTMLRLLVDHPRFSSFDLSSVRRIRYGASPIDDGLLDRILLAFPAVGFVQAYGMTETAPVVTLLAPADHSSEARSDGRGRSAGRATPGAELKIVDDEDREVERGAIGEIAVRGGMVMLGYWNQPELTREAVRGGWMHTGDLGWMSEDGYVTVVDRKKDMIITGGENVYSAEVENALSIHPAVEQVAVVGIAHLTWGEEVCAVVVLRSGLTVGEDDLRLFARDRIAGYKIPRRIEFADSLPLTAAGKVFKGALRELLQQREGPPA